MVIIYKAENARVGDNWHYAVLITFFFFIVIFVLLLLLIIIITNIIIMIKLLMQSCASWGHTVVAF